MEPLKRLKAITEDTVIPIGLVVVILGFCTWLTTMYNQGKANAEAITELQSKEISRDEKLNKIYRALGRLEGAAGTKPKGEYEDESGQ